MKLCAFLEENKQALSTNPDFKYDDTPYNRMALFRIPSFDYLTMILKHPPFNYSSIVNVCNITGPVFGIELMNDPDFDPTSIHETFENYNYKIAYKNKVLIIRLKEFFSIEGDELREI